MTPFKLFSIPEESVPAKIMPLEGKVSLLSFLCTMHIHPYSGTENP
jgi:hypothetical protein